METNAKPAAQVARLTKDEAAAKVEEWVKAGLPAGRIYPLVYRVVILCRRREDVDAWADALQSAARLERNLDPKAPDDSYCTPEIETVALAGWKLYAFCPVPKTRTRSKVRIEVAAVANA